jgi:fructose-1-phosphate kinase PfkB-like protein
VSDDEVAALLDRLHGALPRCNALALCGTQPIGARELYAQTCAAVAAQPALERLIVLLDGHTYVAGALASGRLDVLKLNADELAALTGERDVRRAAERLLRGERPPLRRPHALLAVTDGAHAAHLFAASGGAWRFTPPRVECVNAVGAGDVCTAVFLSELGRGLEAHDAFAWGLAGGAARCLQQTPSFDVAQVHKLRQRVVREEIPGV